MPSVRKPRRRRGDEPLKPNDRFSPWPATPAGERVRDCALVLYAHGFVVGPAYDRILARIKEWETVHGALKGPGRRA